jgi:epoxyqueuosine reductase
MPIRSKYSQMIKAEALRLGFSSVGIAKAEYLETDASHLTQWLENGFHGEMHYMENHFDKRLDPTLLVDGAKSVVVVTHNYFPENSLDPDTYQLARYAYGEDYHFVLKDKLQQLLQYIKEQISPTHARIFTDSAPVLERAWAVKAGLGWQGKNTLLIQKGKGSYFFLAEIILDLDLAYDVPFTTDHCGTCTRCIDACPTQAILPNKILDARNCISYLTIESKSEIPETFQNQWQDWIFGCDICQEVCPWNHFALPHNEPKFQAVPGLMDLSRRNWEEITADIFEKIFKNSPLKRTKWEGIKRNVSFIQGKT